MPLVWQQPRVGHIAVQAWRQHQDHDADFVAFAAEFLATQTMAEFVQHLGNGQSRTRNASRPKNS